MNVPAGGPLTVRPFGSRALLAELADPASVRPLWSRLHAAHREGEAALTGIEEIVAGARTVLVVADPARADLVGLAAQLPGWLDRAAPAGPDGYRGPPGREVEIPVAYDGPDLEAVARLTGLSAGEVAARHERSSWTVAFVGFAPGFAYLEGGDPSLRVPRRDEPRPVVPPGSVGLAGPMGAVYPSALPGGWQLIGRTDVNLFDPGREPPGLLAPGDRVRFRRVGQVSTPVPAPAGGARAAGAGGGRESPLVEVIRPGPLTTVQDRGRIGHAHEGVPRAGAVDPVSLRAANDLVGNPPDAAGLETTLAGPTLRFPLGAMVALAGTDAGATINGEPVPRFPVPVPPGSVLGIGSARRGLRTYVAVAGGVAVAPVLGSRSADTLSGLGPPPLRQGDLLPLGRPRGRGRGGVPGRPGVAPAAGDEVVVRAVSGPRADWLAPGGWDALAGAGLTVSPASDRVGVRLDGPPLPLARRDELASEGMVAGAVQVPPAGHPVILLANHATTGGYPAVAVVVWDDLPLLAQARPGTRVRVDLVG